MGSKNFLNVTIESKSTLSKNKQKSCESYDSTSSNYSQVSEKSDTSLTNAELDNTSKSASVFSNSELTQFDFSSHDAHIKRTLWQKAIGSFRSYKDKGAQKTNKSVVSPSPSPQPSECQEMDPVYHLLKCAASHKKCMDSENSGSHDQHSSVMHKIISGMHLDVSKGCTDPTCPCNQPDKIPVVKKEDLGQQAKRELSIKKCTNTPLRQSTVNSRTSSITKTFTKH